MGRHQHLTGTWRARGLDGLDPGMAHTLTIVKKGSRFVGSDSASRGITRGAVLSACHGGRLRAVGGRMGRPAGWPGRCRTMAGGLMAWCRTPGGPPARSSRFASP